MMNASNDNFITVILSNYNYGKYIAQAIDSVLNQSYKNFELIVVDDGSTDNSAKIISSYNDSRLIKLFTENSGQSAAFNAAFELAKGSLIAFIDSDDWWKGNKLEKVIEWHNFLNGGYAVLQHKLDVWCDGAIKPYKQILPVGNCFAEMIKTGNIDFFVPTSGLVFPKTVLGKIFPIPHEINICADAYLMRSAFVFGDVYSIPETLGFYRKHKKNFVFKNENFDYKKVLNKIIFPYLNNFYSKQGIEFQFKCTDYNKLILHRIVKRIKQYMK